MSKRKEDFAGNDNEQLVQKYTSKLKKIVEKSIKTGKNRTALDAISACAGIYYNWNQKYTDNDLEQYTVSISRKMIHAGFSSYQLNEKNVLFYDSFGIDVRGLVIIYLKALGELGYKVIYVTHKGAMDKQPELHLATKGFDIEWIYINQYNRFEKAREITEAFEKYHPANAFFYSNPEDVSAAVVFNAYEGVVTRFLINLTDHAYWLGKCAFDYCLEFRNYGAYISSEYRKIDTNKLIFLPFYPYYRKRAFQGFPFETEGKKIIFSGGDLYKTLGDSNNTYYYIVDKLLSKHNDVVFLYAGSGDASELNKIIQKYPDRAFHISERDDLYELMEHSTIYLNTYPLIGGLMMQYAVVAGKLPLTLNNKEAAMSECIFNQKVVEYDNALDLLCEADKLLGDKLYLQKRNQELKNSVISQEHFKRALKQVLEKQDTDFSFCVQKTSTNNFRRIYAKNFNFVCIMKNIASIDKISLVMYFAGMFVKRIVKLM